MHVCHVLKFFHWEKSPGNWLTLLPLTASRVGEESGTGGEAAGKGDTWKDNTGIEGKNKRL